MALVRGSNFRLIALPVPGLGPTFALFAALLCWFELVGVRVVCLQGWSPASAMRECGAVVESKSTSKLFSDRSIRSTFDVNLLLSSPSTILRLSVNGITTTCYLGLPDHSWNPAMADLNPPHKISEIIQVWLVSSAPTYHSQL